MKLINQSAQYLPQQAGIDGIYKQIELAGRTSYLSWDKMTDDSAKKFVDMLIKSKHTSVLEHGTIYLKIQTDSFSIGKYHHEGTILTSQFEVNSYSKVHYDDAEVAYITTNYRSLLEYFDEDDVEFMLRKYLCEPTEFHEKRLSVKVITDIGVTREFNRHRTFSIVEQSTRYCNFSKDKFGNEITFIKPYWYDSMKDIPINDEWNVVDEFIASLEGNEETYNLLIRKGLQPQQVRQVLPLSTKTEVVYTAFESDWRHFFDLRLFGKTGEPHPDMLVLANLIKQEFEKAGVWEGIIKYPSKYE